MDMKEGDTEMKRMYVVAALSLFALLVIAAGCQRPKMSEMMVQPERPAALDKLDVFVGTWTGESTATMPNSDEKLTGTGVNKVYWTADNWLLVEELEVTMENGEKMKGMGVWTYDPSIKKFRVHWFDNWGMIATATSHYDEDAGLWRMKGKSEMLAKNFTSHGKGTAKMVGPDTMEWHHSEYMGPLMMFKMFEMKGVNHRTGS